jgi:hypothetical protein
MAAGFFSAQRTQIFMIYTDYSPDDGTGVNHKNLRPLCAIFVQEAQASGRVASPFFLAK